MMLNQDKLTKKQLKKNNIVENICAVLVSFALSFVFTLNNPLHIWVGGTVGTDSGVFKTISLMIDKGFMPYKDTFDHKGPLTYIINWAGDQIASYKGVWLILLLLLTITFFVIYKTARLSAKRTAATVVTLVSAALLFVYYEGGNLTEEYAMPLIAIATFIFIDYFKNNKINKIRLIICGGTFAGTLLLRPNMIAIWFVMCIAVLIKSLTERKYKELFSFVLWFVSGILLVSLPIIIWLYSNGAFAQFIQDYIVFNFKYTSAEGGFGTFANKWFSFFFYFGSAVNLVSFFAQIYISKKSKSILDFSYLAYMPVTILFISLSGNYYGHYGMILIPMFAYPLSGIFAAVDKLENRHESEVLSLLLSLSMLVAFVAPNWISLVQTIPKTYAVRKNDNISSVVRDISNNLDMLGIAKEDSISVYGNWDIIYVISKRPHATRYSYQFPIGKVKPEIMDEYFDELKNELPKAIVVQEGRYDDRIQTFIKENEYNFVYGQYGNADSGGALLFYKSK